MRRITLCLREEAGLMKIAIVPHMRHGQNDVPWLLQVKEGKRKWEFEEIGFPLRDRIKAYLSSRPLKSAFLSWSISI